MSTLGEELYPPEGIYIILKAISLKHSIYTNILIMRLQYEFSKPSNMGLQKKLVDPYSSAYGPIKISVHPKKTAAPRTKFMYLQFSSCSIFALWLTAFDAAIAEPRCGFVFVSSIRCMYGFHFQYYRHRSALSTKAPQRYIFIYVFILLYSTFQIPNLTLNARTAAPSANEMYTENMFLCCAMIWRAAVAQHVVHVRVVVVVMVRQTILVFTIYS